MLLVETYISESPGKGFGLFANELIPKNTVIWQFIEGLDIKFHKDIYETLNHVQQKHIDKYFWRDGDYYYSSCDHSVFQNHTSNPNCVVFEEDKMIASRDIYPDEEITVSYDTFDDDFNLYKDQLQW
jgi:hypothetical protein